MALIDPRRLERECFVRSIELLHPRFVTLGYSSVAEYGKASEDNPPWAVLFHVGSRRLSDPDVNSEFQALIQLRGRSPVVVLAPYDDVHQMIAAMDAGAAGYIPTSLGIDGIVEAAKLAASGGVFLRHESLARLRSSIAAEAAPQSDAECLTSRQAAVADALRRGKANKTIAYELNMCESTVKVHIRNIMRKVKATNRTEAAFKLNAILPNADL